MMGRFIDGVRDWMHPAELDRNTSSDLAHDVGLSPSELPRLAGHDAHSADLLPRRLAALGIDAEVGPWMLRDVQRLCTVCPHKKRCCHDLAARADDVAWKGYCLNASNFAACSEE
jgi:hypothetical protein